MKKFKKFLSVLCVACMIFSLAVPALAATPTSDDTQQVRVVSIGDNGETVEYNVNVVVPRGTAKDEESRLLFDAAYNVAGIPTTRTVRSMSNPIISKEGARILTADPKESGTYMGTSAALDKLYSQVAVKITITSGSCERLNARLHNATGDTDTWATTTGIAPETTTIILYHHGTHDGDLLSLTKGSILSLYCSTGTTEEADGNIYADVEAEIS